MNAPPALKAACLGLWSRRQRDRQLFSLWPGPRQVWPPCRAQVFSFSEVCVLARLGPSSRLGCKGGQERRLRYIAMIALMPSRASASGSEPLSHCLRMAPICPLTGPPAPSVGTSLDCCWLSVHGGFSQSMGELFSAFWGIQGCSSVRRVTDRPKTLERKARRCAPGQVNAGTGNFVSRSLLRMEITLQCRSREGRAALHRRAWTIQQPLWPEVPRAHTRIRGSRRHDRGALEAREAHCRHCTDGGCGRGLSSPGAASTRAFQHSGAAQPYPILDERELSSRASNVLQMR